MLRSTLPSKLPEGVCEVIPGALYVGGHSAASTMIVDWNVRCVVRCLEEPHDYQQLLDDVWVQEATTSYEEERAALQQQRAAALSSSGAAPTDCAECDTAAKPCEPAEEVVDLDATTDEGGVGDGHITTSQPDPSGSKARASPTPTREDFLRHRPAEYEVRTFHCPMEDSMAFSLLDFEPFQSALKFIDDAMLQRGATFGDWEEQPTAEDEQPANNNGDNIDNGNVGGESADLPLPAVYVHCLAGRSRSPALVLAYLMTRKQLTLQEALDMLAPQMRPNPNFIKQLMELEGDMLEHDDTGRAHQARFDLHGYFVDGLSQMHPMIPEDVVVACLDACGLDVEMARMMLTKKAFQMAKDKASIESLLAVLNEGLQEQDCGRLTEAEAYAAFTESEKNRTVALKQLMELQRARQLRGAANGEGVSKSAPNAS